MAFCTKYETLLLSNPINKFMRYTAINKENETINIVRYGLFLYSQLDKAFESPIEKNFIIKYKRLDSKKKY